MSKYDTAYFDRLSERREQAAHRTQPEPDTSRIPAARPSRTQRLASKYDTAYFDRLSERREQAAHPTQPEPGAMDQLGYPPYDPSMWRLTLENIFHLIVIICAMVGFCGLVAEASGHAFAC